MVVITAASYADFKALTPILGQPSADAVQFFVRDGVGLGTGFQVVGINETQQVAFRWTDVVKPPTFDADYPKRLVVRDITIV